MPTLRAFVWLRWRLLVNGLRGGRRRDTVEQLSRVAAMVVPSLLAATSVTSVVLAVAAGGWAGWFMVHGFPAEAGPLLIIPSIRIVLLLATVAAVLVPLAIGAHAGSERQTRLLLLPLSRRRLHVMVMSAGVTDPWVAVLLPGLLAFAVSLGVSALSAPVGWRPSLVWEGLAAVPAGVAFVFLVGSLASVTRFLVSWIVRDRRRSEAFVVVFVLALSAAAMLPALWSQAIEEHGDAAAAPLFAALMERHPPLWAVPLPPNLYVRALEAAASLRPAACVTAIGALAAEGIALFFLSAALHRRVVESAEGVRSHRASPFRGARAIRLPGMWPGTSAVAVAQIRTALRSVRGRLVVALPGPLVAMFALLFRGLHHTSGVEIALGSSGPLAFGAGMLFGLHAAQAFTLNQLASDRAGLTLTFLAPIRDIDVIRGKTIGCGVLLGAGAAISLVCAFAVSPGAPALVWLATLAAGIATYLLLSPVAAWLSVVMPVAADLSKTGMAGNPHSLALLAGSALVAAAGLPPALVIALLPPATGCFIVFIWLAVAIAVSVPLLGVVARLLRARRENLALVAQGR